MTSNAEMDLPTSNTPMEGVPPPMVEDDNPGRTRRRRSRGPFRKVSRRMRRLLGWRRLLVGIVVINIVVILMLSVIVTDAVTRLNDSWGSFSRVLNSISTSEGTELTLNDFTRLQSSLDDLSRQLTAANSRVSVVSPVAQLNADWEASFQALDVATSLADAVEDILTGLQPTLNYMVEGVEGDAIATRISSGERVVELLELGRGLFIRADNQLRLAEAQLNEIDLLNVSSGLLLQIEQLRGYSEQIQDINTLMLQSPDVLTTILGLDEERSYLVLAQNNDEIRPSGGYISTYGWFTVRGGRIINFDYSATTATSPNPPTNDFTGSFDLPDWWIRYREPIFAAWDGSWYADFPQTAELALAYYEAGDNPQAPIDGVLAIDITGFELMLQALGEVRVSDYNTTVTAANFRDVVYDIRAFGQGQDPHKEFVAAVYQSIFEAWQAVDQERTPDLLGALLEGVQSGHVIVHFADPAINESIAQIGWNGAQAPATDGDYVLIADANLGNKSNNSVTRSTTYDVEILPDGSLDSRLSVRYDYFDSVASLDPAVDDEFHGPLNYSNLMQIFLPVGARIGETNNFGVLTMVDSDTHTHLVTRETVAYDTGERYQLRYTVPFIVDDLGDYQRYRLLLQKQLGARVQSVNLQIRLPQNARVIQSTPQTDASYNLEQPILDYRFELDTDQWVEVIYQMGGAG